MSWRLAGRCRTGRRARVVPQRDTAGRHLDEIERERGTRLRGDPEADVMVDGPGQEAVPVGAADLARAVDEGAAADDARPWRLVVLTAVARLVGVRPEGARRPLPHVPREVERAERARATRPASDRGSVGGSEDRVLGRRRLVAPRPRAAVVTPRRALPPGLTRQEAARPAAERLRGEPGDVRHGMFLAARRDGTPRPVRRRAPAGGTDERPILGVRHGRPPDAEGGTGHPVCGSLVLVGRVLGGRVASHGERAGRHVAPLDPGHVPRGITGSTMCEGRSASA